MKTCSKCSVARSYTEYTKDKSKADGLRSSCKICATKFNKQKHANFLKTRLENLEIPTEPNEVWKQTSYENYYISSKGRVFSIPRRGGGGLLKCHTNVYGYDVFSITVNSYTKHLLLHVMLAKAFIPNPQNLPIVDHIDRNRKNNDISNLRWVSPSVNALNSSIRGSIYINKITFNDKMYEYIRLTISGMHIGNFETEEDAKAKLHEIQSSYITYENFQKQYIIK